MNEAGPLPSVERLRWQCRRGMLELDVALDAYLQHRYPELDDNQKHRFVTLLELDDPTLSAWLLGTDTPADSATRDLLADIRAAARQ